MCWGQGTGQRPPTKVPLLRTLWNPEDKVALTMKCTMETSLSTPREGEELTVSLWENLQIEILSASGQQGSCPIRSFVS